MKVCVACDQVFDGIEWRCPGCGWGPELRGGHPVFAPSAAEDSDGFHGSFFEALVKVERGHFWFESRNALIVWALRACFPRAASLLEIGTGTGFVLEAIRRAHPGLTLCGSDVYQAALPVAGRRLPGVPLMQLDARRLPFEAEFDVVGAFDVLEHIDDYSAVLGQMFRASRPGGGILLTVPQHRFLWSAQDEYACHKRRFTRGELVREVRRAGFSVLRTTSFVSAPFPLLLLSRLRKRRTAGFDPFSEVRLPRAVNACLGGLMTLERFGIAAGLSLPFGGSLLLAARR